jgi:large subunit ribosomal protein L32
MGVPKKHTTKSHRDKKRMHIFLKTPCLTICSKCGKLRLSHTVCKNCGYYKGREVLNVLAKLEKKEKKKRKEEMKEQEKEKTKKEKALTMEELSHKKF